MLQVLRRNNLDELYLSKTVENEPNEKATSCQWTGLSILTKLDIIYQLCELRHGLNDIEAKLSDYEANELRIEPLGIDSNGSKLWYFGDLRLYEEKPAKKKVKTEKKKL